MFFIDDAELIRIAPGVERPSADLIAAVSSLVDPADGDGMFKRVERAERAWRGGARDVPPPTLPLLAVSVLAASQMHRDGSGATHAYYIRLAQLLATAKPELDVMAVRHTLREGKAFIDVAKMWMSLDSWLQERKGQSGISTIQGLPHRNRVGYPISQALVRRSDRAALTRFFAALDIGTRGTPGAEALHNYLRIWSASQRGLSEVLQRALNDDSLTPIVSGLLFAIAASWDGAVVTPDGQRELEIRLVIDLADRSTRWAVGTRPGVDHAVLHGNVNADRAELEINRDPYSALYSVRGAFPVTQGSVQGGLRLSGDGVAAVFPASDFIPFAEDADAAGWLSIDAVRAYEDLVLAVVADSASVVERVIREAAEPGWQIVRQSPASPLLAGYVIFSDVVFSDETSLNRALASVPRVATASRIRPRVARAQLVDGLPVARSIARRCYLVGGEPDLLLPVADEIRSVAAALDGREQSPPFRATGFPIPLRAREPLVEGEHLLNVDMEELRFWIAQPGSDPATDQNVGSVGWNDRLELEINPASSVVRGALVDLGDSSEGDRDPVLARRGQDHTWLLSRDGRVDVVAEPHSPSTFAERVSAFVPYYFEVETKPAHVWLLQERAGRWRISRISDQPPRFERMTPAWAVVWSKVDRFLPTPPDPLWDSYVQAWRAARG